MKPYLRIFLVGILTVAALQNVARPVAQAPANPPAVFADPERRAKLAKAFPEIDQMIARFMTQRNVPGAAWGIVIDGELAHVGVAGYRELPSKAPVTRDSVFRIASMTKSFTAMAILKLRDEGRESTRLDS